MSILIMALPRTGSSELGKQLSIKHKLKYIYEPFNLNKNCKEINVNKNDLIKAVLFRRPLFVEEKNRVEWFIEFSKKFDDVILLSRKNLIECAESWAYLTYNLNLKNFKDNQPYLWEQTPNLSGAIKFIERCHKELEFVSNKLNIPITYYEDIYNPNNSGRLRKGNNGEFDKNII